MKHFDVFNGDADGIIALLQLRLAEPKQTQLITGVKRDIALVKQVPTDAGSVTVLDISMEKNSEALNSLLDAGSRVFYVDHHRPGNIPSSDNLTAIIDTDANTCTSLLVNQHLSGKYYLWAIAAAYGDNMFASAQTLADDYDVSQEDRDLLKALGTYINYNGYGRTVDDLHFHPAELFRQLLAFENPLELIADKNSVFHILASAYQQDMANASQGNVLFESKHSYAVELVDDAWSRRVSGVYGNDLANASPDRAHAVLTLNIDSSYTVSVRAPLNNKQGADVVCSQFPTGGGRTAAAGINQLPATQVKEFLSTLDNYYAN